MDLIWDVMVNSSQVLVMNYAHISSTTCAQIFNIYSINGEIIPNSGANIIMLNSHATFQITTNSHHSNIDTNVYEV